MDTEDITSPHFTTHPDPSVDETHTSFIASFIDRFNDGVAIIIYDPSVKPVEDAFRIQVVNEGFLHLLGANIDRETFLKQNAGRAFECIYPADRKNAIAFLLANIQDGASFIRSHRLNDGSPKGIWVNASVKIHRREELFELYVNYTDISELKHKETLLENERSKFAIATEGSDIEAWSVDIATHTLFETVASSAAHGAREPSVTGVPEALVESGAVEPRSAREFCDIYYRLYSGEQHVSADIWMRDACGEGSWCERIRMVNTYDEQGNPKTAYGVGTDVTPLKNVLANERIQREHLQKALDQARTANEAKSEFLSRMSHEMRTPMNAIIGMADLASEETGNPDVIADYLAKIDVSSKFLLGVINDVLDMSKIESGEFNLHPERYSYAEFLDTINALITPLANEKDIHFIFDHFKTAPTIYADKLRLNQIFLNLLSNAIKFTPRGGSVRYFMSATMIDEKKYICDSRIEDTGIGMSPEFQKHLFEPFSQEGKADDPSSHGTGLGLAITKAVVERMGGTIQAVSEQGVGTIFDVHLTLPIYAGEDTKSSKIDHRLQDYDEGVLRDKSILIAEDHPLNSEIAQTLLERVGMKVTCVPDGALAVAALRDAREDGFDLVLMDIRMPTMDGLQATKAIRALSNPQKASLPIIAMTANAFEEDRKKSADAGMNDHLAKPIEPKKLYATLAYWLGDGNPSHPS